jgi:alanine racemase
MVQSPRHWSLQKGQIVRELRISPSAISENVAKLITQAGTAQSMVVVKANGYGHGIELAARAALEGKANWLGTADIDEALTLRQSGITTPVLAWLIGPSSNVSGAIEQGIDLGVSSLGQLEQIAASASVAQPAYIHAKVDSGMGRGGVLPSDWDELFARVAALQAEGRIVARGIFTHMSLRDTESDHRQGDVFVQAIDALAGHGVTPEIRHAASSTAAARSADLRFDMVRLGIASYGIAHTPEQEALHLRPAMRLRGQVIVVKRLPAGHGVGYDLTYTTEKDTTLALVPVGYADGVPRHASSVGPVSLDGKRFSVSGRVSMDQITIDVGDHPVQVGEWVSLFGDPALGDPHVSEWAEAIGTNTYEILTRIGSRVPRITE